MKIFSTLSSALLALMLTLNSVAPALAQNSFTIPGSSFQIINAQDIQNDVSNFLGDHELIKRCLRDKPDQEAEPLTALVATCLALNTFDQSRYSLLKAWSIASKSDLIEAHHQKRTELNTLEFLRILFKTGGISIPAVYEKEHFDSLEAQGVNLRDEDQRALAIAIEIGIIEPPYSREDGNRLKRSLTRDILTVGEALAYSYQTSTSSAAPQTIIQYSPFQNSLFGGSENIELLDVLKRVVQIINNESYYKDQFDEHDAMEAAIKALVDDFKADKYMEYYGVDEYSNFTSNLNGSLEGIGAYVEQKDGKIIIVSPIEGGPAEKTGVHAGDIITHIEGVSTEGMTLQDAINLIRGPKGTKINLTLERKGVRTDYTIVRDKITIPAISTELHDNITVIKLTQFSQTSDIELLNELNKIDASSSGGLIIDLRNNPGGFLTQVVNMVDFFMEADLPAVYINDHKNFDSLNTTQPIIAPKVPVSILINKGSASASEIFAGVLQSYGLAKVYGESSFGKGTVQNIIPIQDVAGGGTAGFKYTVAEYLIPRPDTTWFSIDGVGVTPQSNPGGPTSSLTDDPSTPQDELLNEVMSIMKRGGSRSTQLR